VAAVGALGEGVDKVVVVEGGEREGSSRGIDGVVVADMVDDMHHMDA
jgi:hypothetical protein